MSKFQIFKIGLMQELPLQVGVFPFGIMYGILALESGLDVLQAFFMSSIIFAGASQIAFINLYTTVSPIALITSVTAMNSRHLLYSISINNYLQNLSMKWKLLLSYLLTDEAYAISVSYFNKNKNKNYLHFHLLGTGVTLFVSWQFSTFVGIFFGKTLPVYIDLSFIIPLSFIAIIIPMLKSIEQISSFLISGITGIILYLAKFDLWIICSALVGIISFVAIEKLKIK